MDVSRILKEVQAASGWSQERIAQELKVSFPTLNSWVNGKSTPRSKNREEIALLHAHVRGSDETNNELLKQKLEHAKLCSLSAEEIVNNTIVLDRLVLHMTYHTNTIEGSTMTVEDVENLLLKNTPVNKSAREQLEAKNHKTALLWLLQELSADSFAISEDLIKQLHLRLMNGLVQNAGSYRTHSARILGTRVPLTNWQSIPGEMKKLIADEDDGAEFIANAARFHARFEQIHPFTDGNGRTGRLLLLAQLLQRGITPPIVMKERKHAYYKYLELAQCDHMYTPLQLFITESVVEANDLLM